MEMTIFRLDDRQLGECLFIASASPWQLALLLSTEFIRQSVVFKNSTIVVGTFF